MTLSRLAEYLPESWGASSARSPDAKSAADAMMLAYRNVVEPVEKVAKAYPGAALATAFLLGVTVAWWIKRR